MRANGFRPENSSSFFLPLRKNKSDPAYGQGTYHRRRTAVARPAGAHHRPGRIRSDSGRKLCGGTPPTGTHAPRGRVVRRQTAGRQRSRPGRPDQGDRARCRSDPADRLRQHSGRRAGDQERRVRLHHQRRRQSEDHPVAEPRDGKSQSATEIRRRTAAGNGSVVRGGHRLVESDARRR